MQSPEVVTQVSSSLSQIPYVLAVIVTAFGMFGIHWKVITSIGKTFSKESALRQKQLMTFTETQIAVTKTLVERGEESAKLHVMSALDITKAVATMRARDG